MPGQFSEQLLPAQLPCYVPFPSYISASVLLLTGPAGCLNRNVLSKLCLLPGSCAHLQLGAGLHTTPGSLCRNVILHPAWPGLLGSPRCFSKLPSGAPQSRPLSPKQLQGSAAAAACPPYLRDSRTPDVGQGWERVGFSTLQIIQSTPERATNPTPDSSAFPDVQSKYTRALQYSAARKAKGGASEELYQESEVLLFILSQPREEAEFKRNKSQSWPAACKLHPTLAETRPRCLQPEHTSFQQPPQTLISPWWTL